MATIIPTPMKTIPLEAVLTSPFHHGAGTSGNTSLLRTQDVVQPDGEVKRVPFLSAASIRHGLRDALAYHLVQHAGIKNYSLSKTAVDLLFTGGAVTSTGAKTNLELLRKVNDVLPFLGLLGFAAQSDIITGTLRATDMILVCQENTWRLPEHLHTEKKAAMFRAEEFGTRHDQATTPAGRYLLTIGDEITTAQMIWDNQVLMVGAKLYGELSLTPSAVATPQHELVLGAALGLWAPGGQVVLGAKTAQGYGRALITTLDNKHNAECVAEWSRMVEENQEPIRELIDEMSKK